MLAPAASLSTFFLSQRSPVSCDGKIPLFLTSSHQHDVIPFRPRALGLRPSLPRWASTFLCYGAPFFPFASPSSAASPCLCATGSIYITKRLPFLLQMGPPSPVVISFLSIPPSYRLQCPPLPASPLLFLTPITFPRSPFLSRSFSSRLLLSPASCLRHSRHTLSVWLRDSPSRMLWFDP